MTPKPLRRQNRCGHCSLRGHHISSCHVLHEQRARPDVHDVRACRALLDVRSDGDTRRAVAALLRGLAQDAGGPDDGGPEAGEDP